MAAPFEKDPIGSPGGETPNLLADYIDKAKLASEFDVSPRTIERWVRLRLLPKPLKLGRTRLYHRPSILKHLHSTAANQ